jgi:phage terminase large subunit-like protein
VLIDDALAGYDPRVICKLYAAPVTADPFTLETIRLANPALGNFLNPTEVLAMAQDARRMPSKESEFRNKVLNQRVEACQQFVAPADWKACNAPASNLTKCAEVYGGLDLSEANDLTAMVLVGNIDGVWHVQPWFWLPAEGLFDRARTDRVPYDKWHEQGFLETVPGRAVTYNVVVPRILEILSLHKIKKMAFDRWNMTQFKAFLFERGVTEQTFTEVWQEFGQGTQSMSPALRELESRILNRELAHGDHPILNMNCANAVIDVSKETRNADKKDSANRKLSKKRSTGRIDGMIALAMAIGVSPMTKPKVDIDALIG